MRLLHTSDWHLGRKNNNKSIDSDQLFFIDRIADIVKAEKIDAVLIAGDIYDSAIVAPSAIKLNDYAMRKLIEDCGALVLAVAGNHDGAARLAAHSELLKKSGLFISGALEKNVMCYENDDVQIFLLPWFTPDKVRTLYPDHEDQIEDTDSAYKFVCKKIKGKFADEKKHILVTHSFIVNSETSESDRCAEIGTVGQVSADTFEGFDYVALGHIHKPQNVTERIRYCGTPMPYAFGREEKQEKSVTIIDTEDMSVFIRPLDLLHCRMTLKATYKELVEHNYPADIIDGYLRLELTDDYVTIETMNVLRDIYPNVLEFSGKKFENDGSQTTLTIEQLEEMENDPIKLFRQFYRERTQKEADEHTVELFNNAIRSYEEEV